MQHHLHKQVKFQSTLLSWLGSRKRFFWKAPPTHKPSVGSFCSDADVCESPLNSIECRSVLQNKWHNYVYSTFVQAMSAAVPSPFHFQPSVSARVGRVLLHIWWYVFKSRHKTWNERKLNRVVGVQKRKPYCDQTWKDLDEVTLKEEEKKTKYNGRIGRRCSMTD